MQSYVAGLFAKAYILSVCLSSVLTVCPYDSNYPYSVFLDRDHHFDFSWRVNYKREVMHFRVCVDKLNTTLFGIGFSNYGEMENSDFATYWTGATGVHHFQDMFTDKNGIPHVDKKQDYMLESAQTDGQQVILQYWRKFDTCDMHDYILDRGTTHVIYFASSQSMESFLSGLVNTSDLSSGLQRVQLLKPELNLTPLPEDTWTFEVTAPNILVPAKETTYWWYTAKLPPLKKKHHIIKYEGIIQAGHENLVHHMEVFHCEVAANEIIRFFNGPGLAEGKPPELESCRKVIGAWAMGASAMVLPEEAGFPLGGPNYSRYVLLEVHYNNPDMVAGMVDASGIRFYVTSSLRRHDAGIMELGLEYTNKMAIPPRQEIFPLTGYCIEECTKVSLPAEGIYIYASQLHTHLTGRSVYTKHVRNGVELPELNRDDHYSPHFQEIRRLPVPVRILPGDALITTCEDRTTERDNATIGGFAITDEMCVNYVHYYPVTDLEVCKSSVSTKALQKFFSFMNKWDLDDTMPSKGDRANYQSIRWTPLTTTLLKTLYMTSPISMQCNQSDGHRFPGVWEGVGLTKIKKPLSLPTRRCKHIAS
ncbi:dopamine beta-hydroxylase-like [Mercenaria mercenaria]|uniref:dopamine beta-hydroxylase-like n=1 Tax=Mercenaria mercenaria TaxID=6596 RepID=UPI00234EE5D7|nr:dopamine beta-hydroxylase-like [Mercenaria mercenaria]